MASWGANDPAVQDFGQSDPVVQDGPDMEAALKDVMAVAQRGGSKQQANDLAQARYGVSLDDVSNYYNNKRGVEVWGIPVPRAVGSFITGYGQGLTSNWGDEFRGRIKQGAAYLTGEDPTAAYDQEVADTRDLESSVKHTNPAAYYGGQVAGTINQTVAAPGLTGSKFIAAGQSLPSIAVRSGLVGAAQGAVSGAGAGDQENRGMSSLLGAGTGAAFGTAVPVVTAGVRAGANWLAGKAADLLNPPETIPGVMAAADGGAAGGNRAGLPPDIVVRASEAEAAQRRIAQQLGRDGFADNITPVQLAQQMDSISPQATLGDIGPNLQSEVQTVGSRPGAGKPIVENNLNARQLGAVDPVTGLRPEIGGQSQRVLEQAQRGLGSSGDEVAAAMALKKAERAENADQLYGLAETNFRPVDFSKLNGSLDATIAISKGGIKTALERARAIIDDASGSTYQGMHQSKIALDDLIDSVPKDSAIGNTARAQLKILRDQFLRAVDEVNPGYAAAREKFAGDSAVTDAIDLGTKAISLAGKSLDDLRGQVAQMGSSEKEFFREGLMQGVRDLVLNAPRTTNVARRIDDIPAKLLLLREAFDSQQEFDAFRRALSGESKMFETYSRGLKGSQTQSRIANEMDNADFVEGAASAASDVGSGNIAAMAKRAADWIRNRGYTEGTNAEIARRLTDPTASRDLAFLSRTIDQMRKDALVRKLIGVTTPAAAKLAGGAGGNILSNLLQGRL